MYKKMKNKIKTVIKTNTIDILTFLYTFHDYYPQSHMLE